MLTSYEAQLEQLIQLVWVGLIPTSALDTFINIARRQVAAETECVRDYATLTTVIGQQSYPFSAIVPSSPSATSGIGPVMVVRDITYGVPGAGQKKVYGREWEWFNRYVIANPVPVPTWPKWWAQFGQGAPGSQLAATAGGTLWINLPDIVYTLYLDTACLPITLVNDSTPEAIPQLWTDAVPFYAAWLAMMNVQRQADAEMMLKRYKELTARARTGATPTELPHQFAGAPDPTLANKLGIQQRGAA